MPYALALGMTEDEFWHSNPSIIEAYEKAFELERKTADAELWRLGIYVGRSLSTVLDKLLNGDKAQSEYPEKPFLYENEKNELTEEEKKRQLDAFVMSLKIMESNFNRTHNKGV